MDIRNIEALPKGTGAKYLITLKGQDKELIAKQWARVKPTSLKPDEVLVSMTPPVKGKRILAESITLKPETTLEGAEEIVKKYKNSSEFNTLRNKYGKRKEEEGDIDRIQTVDYPLIHYSKEAREIQQEGFDPEKRNPVLLGFSFLPFKEYTQEELGGLIKKDKITAMFTGAIWDVSAVGDRPIDIYMGNSSSDFEWNNLVKETAKEVGLPLPWRVPEDRDKRVKFANKMREKLLSEGISAIRVGDEISILDPNKIKILNASKDNPIYPPRR